MLEINIKLPWFYKLVNLDSELLLLLAMGFQDESLDFSEEGLLTSWPDSSELKDCFPLSIL